MEVIYRGLDWREEAHFSDDFDSDDLERWSGSETVMESISFCNVFVTQTIVYKDTMYESWFYE